MQHCLTLHNAAHAVLPFAAEHDTAGAWQQQDTVAGLVAVGTNTVLHPYAWNNTWGKMAALELHQPILCSHSQAYAAAVISTNNNAALNAADSTAQQGCIGCIKPP